MPTDAIAPDRRGIPALYHDGNDRKMQMIKQIIRTTAVVLPVTVAAITNPPYDLYGYLADSTDNPPRPDAVRRMSPGEFIMRANSPDCRPVVTSWAETNKTDVVMVNLDGQTVVFDEPLKGPEGIPELMAEELDSPAYSATMESF